MDGFLVSCFHQAGYKFTRQLISRISANIRWTLFESAVTAEFGWVPCVLLPHGWILLHSLALRGIADLNLRFIDFIFAIQVWYNPVLDQTMEHLHKNRELRNNKNVNNYEYLLKRMLYCSGNGQELLSALIRCHSGMPRF